MPAERYGNLSVPISLIVEIEKVIKDPTNGYSSRADFAKEALRMRLAQVKHISSTRNKGAGVHKKQPAEPAAAQPESDAPKSPSKKRRSRKATAAPQAKPGKGSLDSFVEA